LSLIELLIVIAIVALLIGLTLSGVQKVRGAASRARCQNNLRQIALALHSYHGVASRLPPGVTLAGTADPYLFMSWHTRLLPYLEQQTLWDEAVVSFRANPDFLGPPSHPGAERALPVFGCPNDSRTATPQRVADYYTRGLTSYLGVAGWNMDRPDGVLFPNSAVRLTDITDGSSNTLLVGERPPSADMVLGWWYAGWGQNRDGDADMILGVRAKNTSTYAPSCPFGPYPFTAGRFDNQCDAFHFWSPHTGGANFAFADGSVRFLRYSADDILPALATRAGGEVVAVPD
jgi:prepilin-type processing-associated H-X9-DG protein